MTAGSDTKKYVNEYTRIPGHTPRYTGGAFMWPRLKACRWGSGRFRTGTASAPANRTSSVLPARAAQQRYRLRIADLLGGGERRPAIARAMIDLRTGLQQQVYGVGQTALRCQQ